MSNLDQQIPDYELTLVVDKEFTAKSAFRADLRFCEDPDRRWTTSKINRMLDYLSIQANTSMPPEKIGEAYLAAKTLFGNKALATIVEGRGRVALLLDSDGGNVDAEKYYKRVLKTLTAGSNTEIDAFVLGHACSAAFGLLALADDISVLPQSVMMWHFSDDGNNRRQETVSRLEKNQSLRRDYRKELDDLVRFLRRNKYLRYDSKEKLVRDYVLDSKDPEGEVYFSGEQAYVQEMVDACYDDPISMAKYYQQRYLGITNPSVMDFWVLSKVITGAIPGDTEWRYVDFEQARVEARANLNYAAREEIVEEIYGS